MARSVEGSFGRDIIAHSDIADNFFIFMRFSAFYAFSGLRRLNDETFHVSNIILCTDFSPR